MALYKTKNETVDAVQYDGENRIYIEQWMINRYDPEFQLDEWIGDGTYFDALLVIDTPRKITARRNDYVIRGDDGKFYSMNQYLFEKLFDKVEED